MIQTRLLKWALWMGLLAGVAGFSAGELTWNQPAEARAKPLSGTVAQTVYGLSNDIDVAEAAVKASPNDPEAYFLMAIAYSRTPYLERALEALDKARRLTKKSKEGYALFDRKIADYELLLTQTPDDPLLLYRLGFAYYMRGYAIANGYMKDANYQPDWFYDKAESAFRQLIASSPSDIWAHNYLGYLLAERAPEKNYQAAVSLWRQALQIDPQNPGAYMLLGQAAWKNGNLRQAVEYSSQALKVRNAWLEAHHIDPATVKVRL